MPGRIEVHTWLIRTLRSAVLHVAPAVWQALEQLSHLLGERMFVSVASSINPPHLACRWFGRKRVQHRQDRSHSDSRANQHDRPLVCFQNEAAPRRAHFQYVTDLDIREEIVAGGLVAFPFNAETIALRA